jgi:hypothetical protein
MYDNRGYTVLEPLGKGLADMRDGTFFFDRDEQTLYVKLGGEPGWSWVEVSVRAFTLTVSKAHDVVVRGFEARHNRQVGGQWPLAAVSECERVTVEDCKFEFADFCGLGVHSSRDCVVRRCDLSWNGDSGLGLGLTRDCLVEDCTLMFNNYRRFSAGWHAGGMKNIPSNKRTTIRRCEVAYNVDSCGIWFDIDNRDIRILDNVCHHNGLTGIFHEGNGGGGVIAGNLCYGNRGDGIMISDHVPVAGLREVAKRDAQDDADTPDKPLWVVNNTLAANVQGLRTEDRGGWQILRDVRLLNNLFLSNTEPGDVNQGAAAELLFWMHAGPDDKRADTSNHSDYNVFNAATPLILKPGYGFNNTRTFEQWQQRFGEDLHSRLVPVTFTSSHAGFRLVTTTGLDVAAPLPEAVTAVWKPDHPQRVGANLTQWPATGDR